MVYYDVQPLGDLIKAFYTQHKGPDYVDELKIINSWPKMVGPFIAKHTIDLSIRNKVLFVRVDSDSLRNELSYSKSLLLKNLNEVVGKEVISEIVLN
jgi:predicted nucleic acid-binding Zn ribbon protein